MNGGPGRGLAGVEHDGAVDLALTGGVLGDFSDPQLIDLIPPAEHEDTYHRHNPAPTTVGAGTASLH